MGNDRGIGQNSSMAFLVLAIAGVALSVYHWAGIIVAGVAAGLAAKRMRDSIIYGIAAGLVIWMVFTAYGYSVAGARLMDAFFIWIALGIALILSLLSSIAAYGATR